MTFDCIINLIRPFKIRLKREVTGNNNYTNNDRLINCTISLRTGAYILCMISEHSYFKRLVAKNLSKNPGGWLIEFNYNLFSGIKNEKIYSYILRILPIFQCCTVMAIYVRILVVSYTIGLSCGCIWNWVLSQGCLHCVWDILTVYRLYVTGVLLDHKVLAAEHETSSDNTTVSIIIDP